MAKKIHTYKGEEIIVTYDAARCIHAGICVHTLPTVFNVRQRPWVQPNQAPFDDVVNTVLACPTGALQIKDTAGSFKEPIPNKNSITVQCDGPLYLRGNVQVSIDDDTIEATRVALCRCGASENTPFCDGSHQKAGFNEAGHLGTNAKLVAGKTTKGGLCKVVPAKNGPLLIQGYFEIHSANGKTVYAGDQAALCRCGASENKPFCDGTHRKIDFKA